MKRTGIRHKIQMNLRKAEILKELREFFLMREEDKQRKNLKKVKKDR